MIKANILDCTLRDGGYENMWEFGYGNIQGIVERLMETNIEYIELGFLQNDSRGRDFTIFDSIKKIKELYCLKEKKCKSAVMIKNGDYDVSSLEKNAGDSIDLIRVSFHEYDALDALENIKRIKDKGYQVSCNPINTVGYSRVNLIKLLREINTIGPDIFCLVDTFGVLMPDSLKSIFLLIEDYLADSICVGVHLHNNLMMSFPLAVLFIEMSREKRECIIDSCIGGIGRTPGNLSTELIMDLVNEQYNGCYHINPIYEIMDNYVETISEAQNIKKRMAYQLSAKYRVHRNYSEYYLNEKETRLSDINRYLYMISDEHKKVFDKEYAEMLKLKIV